MRGSDEITRERTICELNNPATQEQKARKGKFMPVYDEWVCDATFQIDVENVENIRNAQIPFKCETCEGKKKSTV